MRENSGSSTWNNVVVFLKDANSNGFNLPADETLIVAQREQQWNEAENRWDGYNYTVLSRSNTDEVIERSFDNEGFFSEQQTLNELQIAAAELKTWIDLNGDSNIGGTVESIVYTNNEPRLIPDESLTQDIVFSETGDTYNRITINTDGSITAGSFFNDHPDLKVALEGLSQSNGISEHRFDIWLNSGNKISIRRNNDEDGNWRNSGHSISSDAQQANSASGTDNAYFNDVYQLLSEWSFKDQIYDVVTDWNSLALYKTEVGLVYGQGNFTLNIGDDLATVAWGDGGSTLPGEGSGKLLMVNGYPFQLNAGDSIITAKTGYLEQPNGGSNNTFELFVESDNGDIYICSLTQKDY